VTRSWAWGGGAIPMPVAAASCKVPSTFEIPKEFVELRSLESGHCYQQTQYFHFCDSVSLCKTGTVIVPHAQECPED
jgi:hypothetical protein